MIRLYALFWSSLYPSIFPGPERVVMQEHGWACSLFQNSLDKDFPKQKENVPHPLRILRDQLAGRHNRLAHAARPGRAAGGRLEHVDVAIVVDVEV